MGMKILPEFSEDKVAPQGALNLEDLRKMVLNLVIFTSPATFVFFSLLAQGVPLDKAWPAGLLVIYGIVADYLKKLNDGKK